jgi:hypothetical protein
MAPALVLVSVGFVGCATLGGDPGQPLVPSRYQTRAGSFVVSTAHPVPPDGVEVRGLRSLERELGAGLGLRAPADQPPVEIYILRDRQAFAHFLTFYFPELPSRRAFFLAQGPRRVVYTFQNDRLDEDLRHEATHALLHASVGDLPIWLDEGLAEYFEVPEGREGLNPEHLARLPEDLEAGWRPDLARLETLQTVREMSPRDYRESWAWVHFLLNEPGPGRAALLAYLDDLRSTAAPAAPLSQRLAGLAPGADRQLLAHLERVGTSAPTAPLATKRPRPEPTVLLQNSGLEPAPRSAPRLSLLRRLLSLFLGSGRAS